MESIAFTPQMTRDFIKMNLGPELERAGLHDLKLLINDDTRLFAALTADVVRCTTYSFVSL